MHEPVLFAGYGELDRHIAGDAIETRLLRTGEPRR